MLLDKKTFRTIVRYAPLASLDLIIESSESKILLGKRVNRPAQGFWFVPGGRILKNELISDAFRRISDAEIGKRCEIYDTEFLGVYEHHYIDNFYDAEFSTHYIALGYRFSCDINIKKLPNNQHQQYRWFDVDEILTSDDVHDNTKAYFLPRKYQHNGCL